jgi:hypothetical protein
MGLFAKHTFFNAAQSQMEMGTDVSWLPFAKSVSSLHHTQTRAHVHTNTPKHTVRVTSGCGGHGSAYPESSPMSSGSSTSSLLLTLKKVRVANVVMDEGKRTSLFCLQE